MFNICVQFIIPIVTCEVFGTFLLISLPHLLTDTGARLGTSIFYNASCMIYPRSPALSLTNYFINKVISKNRFTGRRFI